MGVSPWFPSGVTELPSARIVLFTDDVNVVNRIAENATDKDGVAFTGYLESPTLNRQSTGHAMSVSHVLVFYTAIEVTTFTLKVSGDGGNNWTSHTVTVAATTNEIKTVSVGVANIIGGDVRIRIDLDQPELVKIFGYIPRLVRRGLLDVAAC